MIRIGSFKNLSYHATEHYEHVYTHLLNPYGKIGPAFEVDHYFKSTRCCKRKTFKDLLAGDLTFLNHLKKKHHSWLVKADVSTILLNLYNNTFSLRGHFVGHPEEEYNAFKLTNALEINVCPYCNRNYIYNVKPGNGHGVRFNQIDHYYPKDKFPYLAMSFYNLIPSCGQCNFLKNNKKVTFHPYRPYAGDVVKFFISYRLNNPRTSLTSCRPEDLEMRHSKVMSQNMKILYLEELYRGHMDIVNELLFKIESYQGGYYKEIKKLLNDPSFSKEDMYRILFGNYYADEKLSMRPLSKLTKDILEQFKIKL